ncbi:MAG TPA: hypothetical protein VI953_01460 [Candidatus Paceibacterota bacterium]
MEYSFCRDCEQRTELTDLGSAEVSVTAKIIVGGVTREVTESRKVDWLCGQCRNGEHNERRAFTAEDHIRRAVGEATQYLSKKSRANVY